MLVPPSIQFRGNQEKAISLKSKALQFYKFIVTQADIGGVAFISRSLPLEDGSLIRISSYKESIYGLRTGFVTIIGNAYDIVKEELIPRFFIFTPTGLYNYINDKKKSLVSFKSGSHFGYMPRPHDLMLSRSVMLGSPSLFHSGELQAQSTDNDLNICYSKYPNITDYDALFG